MADNEFILYDYFRSTASFRVRIALSFKGLNYQLKEVHLVKNDQHAEQFAQLNPFELVPVLVDGEHQLNQSLAIIQYLEDRYPQAPLLPEDPILKAKVLALSYAICCDIHPLNNLRVLQYLQGEFALSDEKKMQWYFHWLEKGFNGVEETLKNKRFSFALSDQFTLADICLVAQTYNAQRFQFDLTCYPCIKTHYEKVSQLPFVAKVHPEYSS